MTFLRKKFPFSRPKFLMTFFSHRPGFSDFSCLFKDFPYLCCHVIYDPFFTRNPLFFTLFVLSCFRAHPSNITSQNIGGTDALAVPHLKVWGNRPPDPL